jgi:hypothetical protein
MFGTTPPLRLIVWELVVHHDVHFLSILVVIRILCMYVCAYEHQYPTYTEEVLAVVCRHLIETMCAYICILYTRSLSVSLFHTYKKKTDAGTLRFDKVARMHAYLSLR